MASARNVLILGGGASGTLLAIQLLRTDARINVTLIERNGKPGKGVAYGSTDPIHLLNIRAANMSAYPEDPDHFVRWLTESSGDRGSGRNDNFLFASRLAFGDYLTSQLQELGARSERLTHIPGEAVALTRMPNGLVVTLDNFRRVSGDIAVVATGYEPPAISGMPSNLIPWLRVDRSTLKDLDRVLLLGTGLSMVDHVQSLIAAGYQGNILAISRRGLLPQAHRPVEPADIDAEDVPIGQSLGKVFRWFRKRAEQAEAEASDWRAVLDGLRPYVQDLWRSFSVADQYRFVRHARPWWDVRRHRMAPKVAAAIDDLVKSGRLVIIPSKIVSVVPREGGLAGFDVRYRRRGKYEIETTDVQGITDCTGFSIDISKARNPLVRSLLDRGLARPDRLGLGFDVDSIGAVINARGQPAPDIFAIGPLTRGAFWEITGIPDIRAQCEHLAKRLARSSETNQGSETTRAASQ